MNQGHKLGGYKMMDISFQNKCLKWAWIPHIFCNFNCFWVEYINSNLHFPIEHILVGNLQKKCITSCLGLLCQINFGMKFSNIGLNLNLFNTFLSFEDVANQPIWHISNIKYHEKLLYIVTLTH